MNKFETYDSPKRVELVFVDDLITKLKAGDKGYETGYSTDPWDEVQYHFKWDNGSTLSLYRNKDTWRYIEEPRELVQGDTYSHEEMENIFGKKFDPDDRIITFGEH